MWAGIIVRALDTSLPWYRRKVGGRVRESTPQWAALDLPDGACIELFQGDPKTPGSTFPSYGSDPGPPLLPGFAVEDPKQSAEGLRVARSFPGWVVVIAPDGLRVALLSSDAGPASTLVGFRLDSPRPSDLRVFLDELGLTAEVRKAAVSRVAPVLLLTRAGDQTLVDPDGNEIALAPGRT